MGLFNKRKQSLPLPVGQTLCLLESDDSAQVMQQYHERIGPEAIAVLAPVTAAIWVAQGLNQNGFDPEAWLSDISDYRDAASWNEVENPLGVFNTNDVSPGEGAGAWGQFSLSPESQLMGAWNAVGTFDFGEHGTRLVGALFHVAEDLGEGREVWHALKPLSESGIDFDRTDLLSGLPQKLLDYAAQQVAIERMRPDFS